MLDGYDKRIGPPLTPPGRADAPDRTARQRAGHDLVAYGALTTAAALYGGGAIAVKVALLYLPALTAATVRFLLTCAILAALVAALPRFRGPWPARRDVPALVLLGATGVAMFHVCYFAGLQFTTASEGALFASSSPLLTLLLAAALGHERLSLGRAIGAVVSVVGMAFVAFGAGTVGEARNRLLGDAILLGAALGWAIYTLAVRRVTRRYSGLMITFWGAVVGTLLILPGGLWQAGDWHGNLLALPFWLAILYLACGTSIVAYLCWIAGVQRIGPSRTSVFINLSPALALLFAALFWGERLTRVQLLGVALVLLGLYVVNQRPSAVDASA
jgi:drug/metabolite transporter (DMT)-like permease